MSTPPPPPPPPTQVVQVPAVGYRGPVPDKDTFDTQEDFLDSLKPVEIDQVDEEKRRCPHCWKDFGEADPGLNNAEKPVKFRCGHAFGETCMKELFALPGAVLVDVEPMSYIPGSRSYALGAALKAYLQRFSQENGFIDEAAAFSELLDDISTKKRTGVPVGWAAKLQQARIPRPGVRQVHIRENIFIFDIITPSKCSTSTSKSLSPVQPPQGETESSDEDMSDKNSPATSNFSEALIADVASVVSESKASSLTESPDPKAKSSVMITWGKKVELALSMQSKKFEAASKDLAKLQNLETEEAGLLLKEMRARLSKTKEMYTEVLKLLKHPTVATFIPPNVPEQSQHVLPANPQSANPNVNAPTYPYPPYPWPPQFPYHTETLPEFEATQPSAHVNPNQIKTDDETPTIVKKCGPESSEETIHSEFRNLLKDAWTAVAIFNVAVKIKLQHKQQEELLKLQRENAKAQREQLEKDINEKLVAALVVVYKDWLNQEHDRFMSGVSPPIKRMRLDVEIPSHAIGAYRANVPKEAIAVSTIVHSTDDNAACCLVNAPWIPRPKSANSEGDSEEEEEDEEEEILHHVSKRGIFLYRQYCSACLDGEKTLPVPQKLEWKRSNNAPDGCPVCRKVLFAKKGFRKDNEKAKAFCPAASNA